MTERKVLLRFSRESIVRRRHVLWIFNIFCVRMQKANCQRLRILRLYLNKSWEREKETKFLLHSKFMINYSVWVFRNKLHREQQRKRKRRWNLVLIFGRRFQKTENFIHFLDQAQSSDADSEPSCLELHSVYLSLQFQVMQFRIVQLKWQQVAHHCNSDSLHPFSTIQRRVEVSEKDAWGTLNRCVWLNCL